MQPAEQRKWIQKLKKRYEKNISFFQKKVPFLYELSKLLGKRNVEIEIGPWGPNLRIEGQKIYPANRNPKEIGYEQAETFLKKPTRLLFPPSLLLQKTDRLSLNHEILNRMQDLAAGAVAPDYEHDPRFIHFLVTFGLGLGYHLEALLEMTEVKYLVILEEDIEFLKATFYTLDWKAITEYFSRPGRDIFIYIHDDPEVLYQGLEEVYHRTHPMFGVYAYAWGIIHNPLFKKVVKRSKERLFLVLRGWGFFDDEFCSLVQTTANLIKKVPLYLPQKAVAKDVPAIVVGAGPSLDERLEFLKRESEHAVIISCGTAAGALNKAGIIPDIQMLIERPKFVYDVLVSSVTEDWLNNTTIVAANPDWHELFDLGCSSFMFLKANDAGAALFPDKYPYLFDCNPTVTNTGLAWAVSAGFKRIGLVGVDLGTPDPSRHHSKDTAYYDPSSPIKNFRPRTEKVVTTPEGFQVYTDSLYIWAQATMEGLLKKARDVEVFNLSLGLHIEGTKRIEPENWPAHHSKKENALQDIWAKQVVKDYPAHEILKKLEGLPKRAASFSRKAKNFLPKEIAESRYILVKSLCELYRYVFFNLARKDMPLFLLYKGSILHLSNHLFFISYLISDEEKRTEVVAKARELFFEFLDRSVKHLERLREMLNRPEEILALKPNENFLYFWF